MADETLSTPYLRPGTKLRYPVYDSNGMLLLAAGSEVTPRMRGLLDRRGIRLQLQASLRVREGSPADLEIPIKNGRLTIGRSADCEVRPDSDIVSSTHCRVTIRSCGVYLLDLKSTNGTFLNNQRVNGEMELSDADHIRVGKMLFEVHIYAAMAADNEDEQEVLDECILAEPFATDPNEPQTGPTRVIDADGLFLEDQR